MNPDGLALSHFQGARRKKQNDFQRPRISDQAAPRPAELAVFRLMSDAVFWRLHHPITDRSPVAARTQALKSLDGRLIEVV
jgi:hypothetical protein